jgi:HK97 family phage major capsid protein
MENIFNLRRERGEVLTKAESVMLTAQAAGRDLTAAELSSHNAAMARLDELDAAIRTREAKTTIRGMMTNGRILSDPGQPANAIGTRQRPMSTEYNEAFLSFLRSGGKQATRELNAGFDPLFGGFALPALPGMSSALYEGAASSGGAAVSVPTDNLIVPLGVPDLGVRSVAKVIPTSTDIKIPAQTSFGTAGIKLESGASANQFAESNPALSQFTLSAFMTGLTHTVSWELLQDVQMFQEFAVNDLLNAINIAEDGFFVSGTGTNQPQGLIGNVGTGVGSAYALAGTSADAATLINSTLDVLGTLKATYYPNAAWLMNRATATAIRKAQLQSNLFAPIWTRENGRDYLHGFPVAYASSMPSLPTATTAGVTPLLFGSFQDGYVIGDRGGSGTFVKILDQPLATNGQTVLLGYKRVDGRVRRSEAIQAISLSHS